MPGLDGLRGVAVLAVVLSHCAFLVPMDWIWLRRVVDGGWLGVDVFFVLSGFLITALLLDEQDATSRIHFEAFYIRRGLRLLPALYFMLVGFAAYTFASKAPVAPMWTNIAGAVFYVSNWVTVVKPSVVAQGTPHLWSLAVEEQFYLVWPVLLSAFFGIRHKTARVVPMLVGLIAIVALHRLIFWDADGSWDMSSVRTDFRADSLLVGALTAQLWVRRLTPRRGVAAAAWIALVAMGIMKWNAGALGAFWYRGGFTLFATCTAAVVLAVAERVWRPGAGFEHRSLRFVGRVSYGLYLWHVPVIQAVIRYGASWPMWERLLVATVVTAAGVTASWCFIERPALRFKRRWELRDLAPRPNDGSPDLAVSGHVPAAYA